MDGCHFDRLTRTLTAAGGRRRLLGVLATIPLVAGLAAILSPEDAEARERRRRRKQRHKKRKKPGNRKRKHGCKPKGKGKVCAGRCGAVKNRDTCGKTVDCGSCDCTPACGECFTCQGAAGAPGTCVPQPGAPCGAVTCESGTLQPPGSCDGSGSCQPADPVSCAPYTRCEGNACATTCSGDEDCVAGSFCNGSGQCVGDHPNGEGCTHGGQCASGHCVDEVCCDSACDGACQACNLGPTVGTCTTEPEGTSCGGGNICCAGACQACCDSSTCSGTTPLCVSGQCKACSENPAACPANTCCDTGSGTCAAACPGTTPICVSHVCTACSASHPCPGGCCAADGSCQQGESGSACGAVGGTCDVCETTEACTSRLCVPKPCGQGGVCLAFVTSLLRAGDFGGLLAGDAICQGLADGAALEGTYKAWLADSVASPSTRFVQSTGPYRRVDGVTIANNWADLTDGNLLAAINITETGQTAPSDDYRFAWSGVNTDGTAVGGNTNCNGWTSNASGSLGAIGFIDQTGWPWSQPDGAACGHYYRLYCFQQS